MAHFEDALLAGISNKLAREGMRYDIGDKVFIDGWPGNGEEDAFTVLRCERTVFNGEESRRYDLYNDFYNTSKHDVPEDLLRLYKAGTFIDNMSFKMSASRNRRRELVPYFPEKVIFHDPATIVLWGDGTKTVVKCSEGDTYDPEKGYMLCYLKKLMGKNYYKYISKTVKKYKED